MSYERLPSPFFLRCLLGLLALGAVANAQSTWTTVTRNPTPEGRYGHAMAYDSLRGRTVLFGGHNDMTFLNDTWEYDGTTWTLRNLPTSPPARRWHAMAFDSNRGRVVLYGGDNNTAELLVNVTRVGNVGSLTVTIPNDRSLNGTSFFNQAIVVDPGGNPAGVTLSNACEARMRVKS